MLKNIEISHSIVYDFILSMARLNHNDSLSGFIDKYDKELADKIKMDETILKWINKTYPEIPEKYKKLIDVFANRDNFFRLVLLNYVRENNLKTVPEFLDFLLNKNEDEMLIDYLKQLQSYCEKLQNFPDLQEKIKNLDFDMMSIINEMDLPANRKWEMLQFFSNPKKMKDDLIDLIQWYYQNIFEKIESTVEKVILKTEKDIRKKLKNYGSEYVKLLTGTDYSKMEKGRKIVLVISYFLELVILDLYRDESSEDVYFMGFRYNEIFVERKHRVMSNVYLFKALGDETRQNMIRLLTKRDYYGDEFAKEMGLSNSTISYHLSLLLLEGFITVKRTDNKSFISLNKDKLEKQLKLAFNKMISD